MFVGRLVILGIAVLMVVVAFVGFSAQVYDWITILFMAGLATIELRKYRKDKRMYRLVIALPVIIAIILYSPISGLLSHAELITLKVLGSLLIILYFFFEYRVQNKKWS